jgi:hypothetical protein
MVTLDPSKRWGVGNIIPWWGTSHRDLPYINEPFNDVASLDHWNQLGYTQTKFTGDMYDMRNPEPHWMSEFKKHYSGWKHFSWSVYKMTPGCVLPNHSDTYDRFKHIYNVPNAESIYRSIIFLEDWQSGHYFEIDHVPFTNWTAGTVVTWQNDTVHLAANVGMTDRYTLQITGVADENTFL